VKLERIAFGPDARVEGQVVRGDRSPRPGARVVFVSAQRQAPNQSVTAGATGRFQVTLASGSWLVYVQGADGQQAFHSRLEVDGRPASPLTVVTR
jgi:hypothetical protein